jgi:hypothetical protein
MRIVNIMVAVVLLCGFICGCDSERATQMRESLREKREANKEARLHRVMAVSPKSFDYLHPTVVDSLQPVFKWKSASAVQTVDFGIWEAVKTHPKSMYDLRGRLVFSKERISGKEYRLERPLEPGTVYFWSVKETGSSHWDVKSIGNRSLLTGSSYTITGLFFLMQTPKE